MDIISCGIYLFDKSNKLLVEHPTGHKSNIWTIPKGRMDIGEIDYFEVAKRELFEETGVILDNLNITKYEEFEMIRYGSTNKYLKSFFIKVDHDFSNFKFVCDSMVYRNNVPVFPEVDDYKLITIEEAKIVLNDFQIRNLDRCEEILKYTMNHLSKFKDY